MGEVFLAEDTRLRRAALRPHRTDARCAAQRFQISIPSAPLWSLKELYSISDWKIPLIHQRYCAYAVIKGTTTQKIRSNFSNKRISASKHLKELNL